MGVMNKRTFNKAKALAEKNKDKIAASVNKATDAIDKKTGGKHADKLKKLDDAAAKFAGNAAAAAPEGAPTGDGPADDDSPDASNEADAQS